MDVAVLGTGTVGRTLAGAIAGAGNSVVIGTRDVGSLLARDDEDPFAVWVQQHPDVRPAAFPDAAEQAELVFNATPGAVSLAVLEAAGPASLDGKVLVDVANPLDFSHGFPPSLTVANTDSLAEQIQRLLPGARVVKALNTVTAALMVAPGAVGGGEHDLPLCGNDEGAKAIVAHALRKWFGWSSIIDLGDLSAARGMEAYLLWWVRMMGATGTPLFNVKVVR